MLLIWIIFVDYKDNEDDNQIVIRCLKIVKIKRYILINITEAI